MDHDSRSGSIDIPIQLEPNYLDADAEWTGFSVPVSPSKANRDDSNSEVEEESGSESGDEDDNGECGLVKGDDMNDVDSVANPADSEPAPKELMEDGVVRIPFMDLRSLKFLIASPLSEET